MNTGGSRVSKVHEKSRSSSDSDLLRWYVVQAKHREEQRAEHFLKEKGFHTYLPLMEVAKIRGSKHSITEKPLFPGYLFCLFDCDSESLAHVRWTRGVAKILPESACPFPINDEVIAGIFDHWASDQGRVRVLLQCINYQASVELHYSHIEKIAWTVS